MSAFFPSDSYPMVYFITWEMHGFPHRFPIAPEKATKHIVWTEPGKLVLILFHNLSDFSSILFQSCGIFHDIGNAWVFYSISHSIGKCNKIHRVGSVWEIGTHTFPIA